MQRRFLVVSDNSKVRASLAAEIRRCGCTVTLADGTDEALMVVRNVDVDVVLLECRKIDAKARRLRTRISRIRPGCDVLLLTNFESVRNSTDLLQFGLEDYLVGGLQLVDLLHAPRAVESRETTTEDDKGVRALTQVLDVLIGLLEMSDPHFSGTSNQAARLVKAVAEDLGVERETMDEVIIGALLRDIGKVGVDSAALTEEGEYTLEQMEMMQQHIDGATRLLEHVDFPWKILPVIRHHHERYDGNGYPDGLKGREIPVGARIVGAVDAYVAMVSERSYRPALDPQEASEVIERQAGKQFDPEVVETLLRILERGQQVVGKDEAPRVLIADADDSFRKHLQMRLRAEGYEADVVDNAEAALASLLDAPPNLILADVGSEKSDAFQLLREIRNDPTLQHLPFAFLADNNDRILRIRALRQGVDDFMTKHGDLEEVVARIGNILTREAARRGDGSRKKRRGITGQLENMGLPDIVQTLTIGMKTARVEISSERRRGKIWFRDGAAVHAKTGELSGEEAFMAMVGWTDGGFTIEHGVRTRSTTIQNDAMFLLMEGMRMMDEKNESCSHTTRPHSSC